MKPSVIPSAKANLFIVGAPKCGTTAWVEYLRTHPDIFFPEIKEPHYFALDFPTFRQVGSADDYAKLFAGAGGEKIRGEGSVMQLYSTAAAQAIRDYNSEAKIMIFLRDQEDMLPSFHHQHLYNFREYLDFDEAWRLSGKRLPDSIPKTSPDPKFLDYAAVGRFAEQVERYLDLFPPDQVRILHFREWTSNPRSAYLQILAFLGVEDDGRTEFPRLHAAKTHRSALLGRIFFHPPRFARQLVKLIKKLSGKPTLGLTRRASKLIEAPGYTTTISSEIREEIRRYYEEDNRRLRDLLASKAEQRADPHVSTAWLDRDAASPRSSSESNP